MFPSLRLTGQLLINLADSVQNKFEFWLKDTVLKPCPA